MKTLAIVFTMFILLVLIPPFAFAGQRTPAQIKSEINEAVKSYRAFRWQAQVQEDKVKALQRELVEKSQKQAIKDEDKVEQLQREMEQKDKE